MRVISVWKSFCFNLVCFVLVTLWTVEHGTDNCPSSIGEIKRESLLNVNRLRESVWPNNFVSYPYFFSLLTQRVTSGARTFYLWPWILSKVLHVCWGGLWRTPPKCFDPPGGHVGVYTRLISLHIEWTARVAWRRYSGHFVLLTQRIFVHIQVDLSRHRCNLRESDVCT